VRWAALALAAFALAGCETSAEKSAKLETAAKRIARNAPHGLSITHASSSVRVLATTVVHSSEGTAAVITLRNDSARALRAVPIEITVKDTAGAVLYRNTAPGLSPSLVSIALVPAHATLTWIDDQVAAAGAPSTVSAEIGEAAAIRAAIPELSVSATHVSEQSANGGALEGSVVNHSAIAQHELVIDGVARRGTRIVAAGRGVLSEAAPNTSTRFQLFFVGDPSGSQLELHAVASTPG
jgi:hypothetical protein